jgi:3-oxoacyl-[acyl-carrier-protein] synthase-3
MPLTRDDWTEHLLRRLQEVQRSLGVDPSGGEDAHARFADVLDSMGMAEFLAILAADCGVTAGELEACAGRRFGSVAELAECLLTAGLAPRPSSTRPEEERDPFRSRGWLTASAVRLPRTVQAAAAVNAALQRLAGWLEEHAGIAGRTMWAGEDPLTAAVTAGRECLERAGLLVEEVGTLFVTAEAPPLLAGLGAALHHGLDLRPDTPVFELNNACTGFLAACRLAQTLLPEVGAVLIIAVEAPTFFLPLQPGPAGEAAALFGDGAAACLLGAEAIGPEAVPLGEVVLGADGRSGGLIQVQRTPAGQAALRLDGVPLASRAVERMAESVRDVVKQWRLPVADLAGVVAHGGNGRLPALLARQLGVPPDRVWSTVAHTGNLGSASLPAAWAMRQPAPRGPVVWTAVGAGLLWAAMRSGTPEG